MPHPVLVAAEQFKAQALARERAAALQLVRAYGQVYRDLDPQIRALEEIVRASGQLTRGQVSRLNALRVLRAQTVEQINRYAAYADVAIVEQVRLNIAAGLADSEALVQAHIDPDWLAQNGLRLNADVTRGLSASWTRVPAESVEQMIGMTQPTAPLRAALVNRLGETVAQQMVDALVTGIATGQNPRVIARRCMGAGLNYSLNTARTAQLWAYRSASSANYRANRDIVAGWRWHATMSSRTCVSCLTMHGRRFSVDEELNDHHAGRCLLPGQLVTTLRGLIPIEAVRVGDMVLTHRGRWRAVIATSQRPHSGVVYRFLQGGAAITVTPEHPMLTQRGWVAARDCSAFDTFWTLNDIDALVSNRNTVQPSVSSFASLAASRRMRESVMCQRGSSSTASMTAGNAASILYEPTASCGTGDNPSARKASRNSSSRGVQNVCQSRCLVWARATARRRLASGDCIRVMALGLRSIWRSAASLDEIGSSPATRIQRINVRVLTPASTHNLRYEARSTTYRRRNQSAIGSPKRVTACASYRSVLSAPTSCGVNHNPSAFARCCTALCVRLGSNAAMSIGSSAPNDSLMMRSSSDVHALPAMIPPLCTGTIIQRPLHIAQIGYVGLVYNLQVDADESYVANGIVVHNCTAIPIVPLASKLGLPEPEMGDAETWFRAQAEKAQQQQMGAGIWEEWHSGRVRFADLTTTYEDAVYGTMRRAPTLEAVLAGVR